MNPELWQHLQSLHRQGRDAVVVTVTGVRGSVPTDLGSKMLVSGEGLCHGTVGGGKIEAHVLRHAQRLLADAAARACETRCWNLQQDIGMTCGGEMTLLFEVQRARASWQIVIFGAGHVVQSLVPVLAPLACQVTVVDIRQEWLERLPAAPNLETIWVERFEDGAARVPMHAHVLSITQGHSTDVPVLCALFGKEGRFPFVGVIGSRSKRAALLRDLRDAGIAPEKMDSLHCPLGWSLGNNSPAEMAISIAAQLLHVRDAPVSSAGPAPVCGCGHALSPRGSSRPE